MSLSSLYRDSKLAHAAVSGTVRFKLKRCDYCLADRFVCVSGVMFVLAHNRKRDNLSFLYDLGRL